MTFAIPVFVHPSNEYTMLWGRHPILKNAPRRLGGALRTTGVTAPGSAITRLTRRWRADCHKRRRLTDRPSTMPRAIHAAIHQARVNARGAFILGDSEPTLPAMGCVPATLLCRDAGAMLPFSEDHTQRRPWLVVNPGEAPATPRASWLQPSGSTNFPGTACLPRATKSPRLPVLHAVAAALRCSPPVPLPLDH